MACRVVRVCVVWGIAKNLGLSYIISELQQLSVALWVNNARVILRYWALQGIDIDDNPLFP